MSFFTIENLKSVGLSDEQIKIIFNEREKELSKFNNYEEIKQKYKEQGEELNKLKQLEPEKLINRINELSQKHKEELKNVEEEYKKNIKMISIKSQLSGAHDPDLILNLIDLNKVDLSEDGTIKMGLNEQLEELRSTKGFLFKENGNKVDAIEPIESENITQKETDESNLFIDALKKGARI